MSYVITLDIWEVRTMSLYPPLLFYPPFPALRHLYYKWKYYAVRTREEVKGKKEKKICAINDPFGQTLSPGNSGHYFSH